MKLILSRKGFDSASGGVANPILPNGQLCPLPIPDKRSRLRYQDIRFDRVALPGRYDNLGVVVADLTGGRIAPTDPAHLDPDLDAASTQRAVGWRPAFGQAGAAQGHLQNMGVGGGALFLFYGWFRRVELARGKLRYVAGAPDLHLIYGWLQVDSVLDPYCPQGAEPSIPAWLSAHPHCAPGYPRQNAIYMSRLRLSLPGVNQRYLGAGVFPQFHPALQLTAGESRLRSLWHLPDWFYPQSPKQALSYHGSLARWQLGNGHTLLQTVGRGQEFVLDCAHYPKSVGWLHELFSTAISVPPYWSSDAATATNKGIGAASGRCSST